MVGSGGRKEGMPTKKEEGNTTTGGEDSDET